MNLRYEYESPDTNLFQFGERSAHYQFAPHYAESWRVSVLMFRRLTRGVSVFSGVPAEDFLRLQEPDEAQHLSQRLECDATSDQQVRIKPNLIFSRLFSHAG